MKIIFVCQTNLCRSPIAEGILVKLLKEKNIDIEVDSAGFEPFYINDRPDSKSIELAQGLGIDISQHKMRLFTYKDLENADKVFVMDNSDYRNVIDLSKNEEHKEKVEYLLNMLSPGSNKTIVEPYNRNLKNCKNILKDINKACEAIANEIATSKANLD